MELRFIDGQPFIVTRIGKKETLLTPGQAVAAEHCIIAEREAAIAVCRTDADSVQQRLDAALLSGELSRPLRDELVAINEQVDALMDLAGEARDNIKAIWRMVDEHEAAIIAQADQDRIATLTNPYVELLRSYS